MGGLLLHGLLWLAWGTPTPVYDEAGYIAAGRAVADQIRCTAGCEGSLSAALGRLLWHNPGYSAAFVVAELLPGGSALWIRLLQIAAGLLGAACVHRLLERRLSGPWPLLAAAAFALHPTHLFFRLTLWPVAVAACGVALVTLLLDRLDAEPTGGRAWTTGCAYAGLTAVFPPALGAAPLLLGLSLRRHLRPRAAAILVPAAAMWAAFALASTLALGQPALLLSEPENAALGNNPWIADGRGSSLHDKESVRLLRGTVDRACPPTGGLDELRCAAREHRRIARETVRGAPLAAVGRSVLRILETWAPDDYVERHLRDERVGWSSPASPALLALVALAELATLLLVLVAAAGAARSRRVLLLVAAIALCTAPVVFGVGLTRLRQPLLPLVLVAAALTLGRYHRRR